MKKRFLTAALIVVVAMVVWLAARGGGEDPLVKGVTDFGAPKARTTIPAGFKRYEDAARGFSFLYPDGYAATSFPDGAGFAILVQGENGAKGFQVAVTPFDEDLTELTEARVRKDVPDMVMRDARQVSVGTAKGLSFASESAQGQTRELWFVWKGNVYQASAPSGSEPALEEFMRSFEMR